MSDLKARLLDTLAIRPVPFEACGVSCFIRPMTVRERVAFAKDHNARADTNEKFFERVAACSICDESGAILFGLAGVDELAALNGAFVQAAAEAALRLQRIGEDDDPKAPAPSPTTPN